MQQMGAILFRVTDQNSLPIRGAEVILNSVSMGITDELGTLTIENLPIGSSFSYLIVAVGYDRPSGYVNIMSTFQEQTIIMTPVPPWVAPTPPY